MHNYQIGEDGRTAFERIKGRKCRSPLAQFGERVMYMELRDGKDERPKLERNLKDGVWLGINGRTGEHVIGTSEGVVKAYTVKRRPIDERWSLEEVHAVRGTPGKPVPGSSDQRIPVRIRAPEKPIQQPSEQAAIPGGDSKREGRLRAARVHTRL